MLLWRPSTPWWSVSTLFVPAVPPSSFRSRASTIVGSLECSLPSEQWPSIAPLPSSSSRPLWYLWVSHLYWRLLHIFLTFSSSSRIHCRVWVIQLILCFPLILPQSLLLTMSSPCVPLTFFLSFYFSWSISNWGHRLPMWESPLMLTCQTRSSSLIGSSSLFCCPWKHV